MACEKEIGAKEDSRIFDLSNQKIELLPNEKKKALCRFYRRGKISSALDLLSLPCLLANQVEMLDRHLERTESGVRKGGLDRR